MRPLASEHEIVHIDRPEGRLQVIAAGTSGPPVLLLSGAGIDNALLSWRRLIPQLAPTHRVYALDWPHQGGSRPWDGVADHPALLGVLDEVIPVILEATGAERLDLVGLSQGGALTLASAIERPERVRRIVAMAPGGIISFPPVVHQALWLVAKFPGLTSAVTSRMFRTRTGIERFVRSSLIPGPVDDFDEIVGDVLEEATRVGGTGASDWQNASIGPFRMRIDLRPRLGEIRCPALLIQGSKDVGIAPRFTEAAARRIPGARYELIDGAGHWVNRQEPERVGRLVTEFLA